MNVYAVILSDRGHSKITDHMDLEKNMSVKNLGIGTISIPLIWDDRKTDFCKWEY